ncbi:MAG: hypothetical protein WC516_08430 [Patescibacteria group bacterium]
MNYETDTINIQAIKVKDKYYIHQVNIPGWISPSLKGLKFDGESPQEAFLDNWFIINEIPKSVTYKKYGTITNERYELKDKTLASDKIPLTINLSQITIHKYEDAPDEWEGQYASFQSLYTRVFDTSPDTWEEVKFTFDIALEVENISIRPKFKYDLSPRYNSFFHKDVFSTLTEANIHHQTLASIVYPEILWHETPCYLSSEDTYELIRAYIKRNIDPKYAKITSDYDFCFTVEKVIPLAKPLNIPHSRKVGRKTVNEVRLQSTKQVKIFEMTSEKSHYQGYPIIKGFSGINEKELKSKIDSYLEELIEIINMPCKECPNCNGVGVIFDIKEGLTEHK